MWHPADSLPGRKGLLPRNWVGGGASSFWFECCGFWAREPTPSLTTSTLRTLYAHLHVHSSLVNIIVLIFQG